MATDGYEKHARATVNRLKARGFYDFETIHSLIDSTPILHVSFPPSEDDPFPAILPMLGCTGVFDESLATDSSAAETLTPGSFPSGDDVVFPEPPPGPRSIYLHGHAASRLFKSPKDSRIPVCVAATSMQGIVLALAPFHNSCNYASAVVHGYASIVSSEAERLYGVTRITDNLVPGRWENSRKPPTKAELTSTGVLKVEIVSASAKIRVGGPSDDRSDLKNEQVVGSVWTGVVPVWTQYGDPVPTSYNQVRKLPGYLREWVEDKNKTGKDEAISVIAKSNK